MTSEPEEKRAGVHRVKHFIFTRCLPRSRSVSATRQELSGTVDKDYFCDLPTPSLPVLRANFSEHITVKFVAQLPNKRKVWRLVKALCCLNVSLSSSSIPRTAWSVTCELL